MKFPLNVVVTGASSGIGLATAKLFLERGHNVFGIDIKQADSSLADFSTYKHYRRDVSEEESLPDIKDVDILINNAGTQNSGKDMQNNFFGLKYCTEKYGIQPHIKSILMQASVSAHNAAEFPEYCASKGAVLTYTKWVANEVAKYGATCNSLSCGGVLTELNRPVIDDDRLWASIMELTPLKKWASPEEIAEWAYFFTAINKSCTGQDLIIDNGETIQSHFVWVD